MEEYLVEESTDVYDLLWELSNEESSEENDE